MKQKFRTVNPNQDFVALEKEILKYWYEQGIVDKYLHKNDKSKKRFSFLDGPITANNPMGVHHAWGRTYKDLWQRWYNMQGYKQRFQNGFDEQGLWVEVEVEKELGLRNKKDIESLVPQDPFASIEKFVNLCKERVKKYAALQTEQSKRLGYFMDWEHSYHTSSDENNYLIWHFLKQCYNNGLIYKGRDAVPWCPRCGTAISQHEMLTEDYKEVTHDSVFIRYPIKGRKNEFLLVWTTTPWTLPANVAVALEPKGNYVAVNADGLTYYLAERAAKRLGLMPGRMIKGENLLGLLYESPFDHLPRVNKSLGNFVHQTVSTDPLVLSIDTEEGTGFVHIAPGAGSEDFQLAKKLGLPVIEVIDEEANYLDGMEEFTGKNAKEDPYLIINYLRNKEAGRFLFRVVPYRHRYPACWRCKTELVWRVVDEWYISMDKPIRTKGNEGKPKSLREQMKEIVKHIKWIPEFGLKRELEWLDNMHDWLISKKRYWGLALPIWECTKCGNFEVIGSKQELQEKAVEGWKEFDGHSPHRPWVDKIKIKCTKCGQTASRIPDVGNPWLDAGIVPFSTITKDNQGSPLYLSDRKEWEKWFPADFITESFPGQFKNWFYSLLTMSTVLEGRESFKTVLGYGTLLAEDGRPMHKSWGNAIEFNEGADKIGVDIMRWIYARQDPASNLLFGYKIATEIRRRFYLILWNSYKFFVDYANFAGFAEQESKDSPTLKVLDRWIISRLNQVIDETNKFLAEYNATAACHKIEEFVTDDLSGWYIRRSRERKTTFLTTLHKVLVTLCQLLAPFMPFITEEMYRNLIGEDSVHLTDYPKPNKKLINFDLMDKMKKIREIVKCAHSLRKTAGIPVRQPLPKITVVHSIEQPGKEFLQLIKDELNVKDVIWKKDDKTKEPKVELDTNITPDLAEEGRTRELARQIQEARKKAGVQRDKLVDVTAPWLPSSQNLVEWLKKKALIRNLIKGDRLSVSA